jgi:hypothetical protein
MRELCGDYPDRSGQPARGSVAVKVPDGGSGFSPGPADSESGTECSESCDPGSSDPEWDSEPPEAESEGPVTSDSSDSNSSSSDDDSEESDSCSADSGFAKPSSSDTEGDLTPSAPPLEEIEELGQKVVGLSVERCGRCGDF